MASITITKVYTVTLTEDERNEILSALGLLAHLYANGGWVQYDNSESKSRYIKHADRLDDIQTLMDGLVPEVER